LIRESIYILLTYVWFHEYIHEGRTFFWQLKNLILTLWFNFQTYIIFSINLVSQVTLRSSGTDILYGCHLLRCLYNILYFLWLYNEFFIILCNILKKIAELDCCQIIILSIYSWLSLSWIQWDHGKNLSQP
jgi:hypothetical protein